MTTGVVDETTMRTARTKPYLRRALEMSCALAALTALVGCAGLINVDELTKADCVGECDASAPHVGSGSVDRDSGVRAPADGASAPAEPPRPTPDSGAPAPLDATSPQPTNDAGPACGDGTCSSTETCSSCAADCGACRNFLLLSDNFDDNSLDRTLWSSRNDPGASVAERNQQLEITPNTSNGGYAAVESIGTYDFTGREVAVEVKQVSGPGSQLETFFQVNRSQNDYVWIGVAGDTLSLAKRVGGSATSVTRLRYDATTMRWWRMRETGGTIYAEYATGRNGPWVALGSLTNPFPVTALTVVMGAGALGPSPVGGPTIFDNLNK